MHHLLRNEISRFLRLAIAFAIAHLAILRLSMALYPLFAEEAAKSSVGLLAYSLIGLIFGLYQMNTYRRPHLWAWLINRPLKTRQIFLSLTGAAAALIGLVVVAPIFLITVYADFMTAQWVDWRHYLMMPFLFGLVLCTYFLGSFIATSPRRSVFLVAVLAIFFLTREAVGWWIFLPLALVLGWLGFLAFSSFRPDLSAPERRPLTMGATALPVAYAVFWLLSGLIVFSNSMGTIIYEDGPLGFSTFAWNDYWDEGHFAHVTYLDERETLAHGLRLSENSRAHSFLSQLELTDVYEPWGPRLAGFPTRHQLFFNDRRHELVDEEREIWWTFSHDEMLFSGRHMRTQEAAGWMGADGSTAQRPVGLPRFEEIPYVVDSRWLVLPRRIYQVDFKLQRLYLRFEMPADERVAMPFHIHRSYAAALSDKTLYLFDARRLELESGLLEPMTRVALPGLERQLARFQIAEMIDSYLVSFVFGSQGERDFHEARQFVYELPIEGNGAGGEETVLADIALAANFPAPYRWRGFILSPVIQHGHDLVWTAIGPHREERVGLGDIARREVPASVGISALALSLLALALTWLCLEKRRAPAAERRFWLLVTLFLGLPGMIAYWLLAVREESADSQEIKPSPRALALTGLHEQRGMGI